MLKNMPVRLNSLPKKISGQTSISSMPDISVNCTPWWSSNEQPVCQSFAKNLSLQMGSPPYVPPDAAELTQRPRNQDLPSSPSTDYSNKDDTATGGVNSQDQCISSDSDESYKKVGEGLMKPHLFIGNPSFAMPRLQVDKTASMIPAPYGYADPYVNRLFTAYGPNAMIQHQMVKIAPARVPLPLDLSEDGPIYVNAKQYHGILRRRQIRAKLEAQNKLVKNRRPYLHESRHRHALNRVRGSGGRFLPTKKPQQSKPTRFSSPDYPSAHLHETGEREGPMTSCHVLNSDIIFSQSDHGFSSIPDKWEIRGNEGFLNNVTHNRASIVR